MQLFNAKNERIKHAYFRWLRGPGRQCEASVAAVAKAIQRFDAFNRYRDFTTYRSEQAESFKEHLIAQTNARTGELLSKSTIHATCCALSAFILWLAREPGYRRLKQNDAAFFHVSLKDARIATAKRSPRFPMPDEIMRVLMAMPVITDIERRDRAVVAFIFVTASRDGATASMSVGDIDLEAATVHHDARHVNTKASKSYVSAFFPVDDRARAILVDWVTWLRVEKHFGSREPLFPATAIGCGKDLRLQALGLSKDFWKTTGTIRKIFKDSFVRAGLPYFNPHSFRHTIAYIGQKLCRTDAERKAWSQNMGHEHVRTTMEHYGPMETWRQLEVMRELADVRPRSSSEAIREVFEELWREKVAKVEGYR